MRDILFRGKRMDNGEWIYGSLFICTGRINNGNVYICDGGSDFSYGDNGNRVRIGCWREVDPETVGQYVNLLDKKCDMVFEGDILRKRVKVYEFGRKRPIGERYMVGVVIWDDHRLMEAPCWALDSRDERGNKTTYIIMAGCEVIGNKYDNPELTREELTDE